MVSLSKRYPQLPLAHGLAGHPRHRPHLLPELMPCFRRSRASCWENVIWNSSSHVMGQSIAESRPGFHQIRLEVCQPKLTSRSPGPFLGPFSPQIHLSRPPPDLWHRNGQSRRPFGRRLHPQRFAASLKRENEKANQCSGNRPPGGSSVSAPLLSAGAPAQRRQQHQGHNRPRQQPGGRRQRQVVPGSGRGGAAAVTAGRGIRRRGIGVQEAHCGRFAGGRPHLRWHRSGRSGRRPRHW